MLMLTLLLTCTAALQASEIKETKAQQAVKIVPVYVDLQKHNGCCITFKSTDKPYYNCPNKTVVYIPQDALIDFYDHVYGRECPAPMHRMIWACSSYLARYGYLDKNDDEVRKYFSHYDPVSRGITEEHFQRQKEIYEREREALKKMRQRFAKEIASALAQAKDGNLIIIQEKDGIIEHEEDALTVTTVAITDLKDQTIVAALQKARDEQTLSAQKEPIVQLATTVADIAQHFKKPLTSEKADQAREVAAQIAALLQKLHALVAQQSQ